MVKFGPSPPYTLPKRGGPLNFFAPPLRTPPLPIQEPHASRVPPHYTPGKIRGEIRPNFGHRGWGVAGTPPAKTYEPGGNSRPDTNIYTHPMGKGEKLQPPTHAYGHRGGSLIDLTSGGDRPSPPPTLHTGGWKDSCHPWLGSSTQGHGKKYPPPPPHAILHEGDP